VADVALEALAAKGVQDLHWLKAEGLVPSVAISTPIGTPAAHTASAHKVKIYRGD